MEANLAAGQGGTKSIFSPFFISNRSGKICSSIIETKKPTHTEKKKKKKKERIRVVEDPGVRGPSLKSLSD